MKKHNEQILVTGGAGFIGSNYLNAFVPRYPEILFVNVDCLTYAGDPKNITVVGAPNYRFHKVDIRDQEALEKVFAEHAPTGVINFAAESHVDLSIENPSIFVETNIVGTHNLLVLARAHGVTRFHQISTDEVYGSLAKDAPPFTTHSPLAPNSPYSASKAAADLLVRSYHRTFGLNIVISRCSNNYGPHQDTSKIIPKFIANLLAGEKVPLYAKGENIRDWLYVEDHVEAVDLIFRKGTSGTVYNIGGGEELSNINLTRQLLALTGRDESFIQEVADRPGHDFRYASDSGELFRELEWKPRHSFADGIRTTFEWYRERR
ncbi:MAG: dTDP-glucose 4,6-dehydratase [Candidatus Sungbacteria bacterium RIFCSPLOWO2_01_FULL_54_21]|uniref:dTDP-glucose 4,6-dehydratase n=1 Tax=Candidatus Sungbacteria bacterium RIFCSPLOWO2_01_FULL_54_21 TaxID=1802279 RepID=A0A1G2L8D1_9BACT|nr:MAG: dTDP-glucose 4,6-dehydratase [Candidatus Sungbacteria bacterium RIFCSPLOWO2_01_FULL_54_21]